ncbi:alkaline phosphatase [Salinibacter ruber]|uniref:alkaline phosphatase n=2 Tax=Salinibacter ruber TaxID=146919 RepID=UPI002167AD13|nr:alkaline phosphatase [Salinibacter ruber]MCS4054490.1 alkaline phosphatase [Salinibacter ruber]
MPVRSSTFHLLPASRLVSAVRPFFAALVLCLLLAGPAPAQTVPDAPAPEEAPNVILMIPDGFGPASVTMARDYLRWRDGQKELPYDSLQVGSIRTYASDSYITDSAAGGTALATGTKTYNGAVAVDTSRQAVATLLEGAERRGMSTGLVVTSRLTHATPAVFSSHVPDRGQENRIARQQLNKDIEVMLGGGRRHFLPQSAEGSAREDDLDLLQAAQDRGYEVVQTASELSRAGEGQTQENRLLGLFSPAHMAYEIDRDHTQQPSLAAMTETAIDRLSGNGEGYFLMVEGSRIDHAGHGNDAASHLRDILAFNRAAKSALEAAQEDDNTLVVIVSDHETGGLTLGRNRDGEGIYSWRPETLAAVEASSGAIADSIRSVRSTGASEAAKRKRIAGTLTRLTGVQDVPTEIVSNLMTVEGPYAVGNAVSPLVNRQALVGWTSHAHTAVDVNLYAYGPGANAFVGHHDNTTIAQKLANLMDVDLESLTGTLRAGRDAR